MVEAGVALDVVVLLTVPDELIVERITGRRMDPDTGAIYHLKFNPPPEDVAERVVQRKDDTEEACVARLKKYHSETAPIVPFYRDKGLLKEIKGVGAPTQVTKRLITALSP
jgi:adenylate kinase